jgi:predicted MPP superfamily phosphohydrolase
MDGLEVRIALNAIQISDLHIKKYKNLLEPMIEHINKEQANFVIITGDTVHRNDDKELFDIAYSCIDKIKHRTIVIPGDYDAGAMWNEYFGKSSRSSNINGFTIDCLDTSFMGHRYSVGWGEVLEKEDPQQHKWLINSLDENDNYHFIFSHHPHSVVPKEEGDKYLKDNVRGIYSGHVHEPQKFSFKYVNPKRKHFEGGIITVPVKFHGNSVYLRILVKDNDEIIAVPRGIRLKRTVW